MATFGNTVIPTVLVKDWSEFWQRWNQNTVWDLEYYNGVEWVSVKGDMQIVKAYPEPWLCKLTLKFTASQAADYRLTFAINKAVKDYVHKEAEHCYSITIDDETLLFDWNDVLAIPGIVISHGVKDGFFWWRLRRDNVPLGAQVTIDPTFGYDTKGASSLNDNTRAKVTWFTMPQDGLAEKITIYVKNTGASAEDIDVGICYPQVDQPPLIAHVVKSVPAGYDGWIDVAFPNTPLTAGVNGLAFKQKGADLTCYYDAGTTNQTYEDTGMAPTDNLANPFGHDNHGNYKYSIYCTYTPFCGGSEVYYYFKGRR